LRCGEDFLDDKALDATAEVATVDAIAVADHVFG
jgi:hypothetical protein